MEKNHYLCNRYYRQKEMVQFIGVHKAKVDDRGRVVFPAAFKAAMGPGADLRLVVKSALFTDCLELFTYAEWETESAAVRAKLSFFNREHDRFWREYMRETAIVEPDDKLGRILIPKPLLEKAGITSGTEVVFAGNNHKIEIWPKEHYEAQKLDSESYTALAEKILG